MERDSLHGGDDDQPLSLYYKSHMRNPMAMVMEPYLSKPYYTTFPLSNGQGLLKAPPLSLLPLSLQPPPQQPPLLPLPASLPRRTSSCPAPAIKIGQKKSKNSSKPKNRNNITPRKEERETPKRSSNTVTVSSTSKFGSDTMKKLPKNIARVKYFDDSIGEGSVVFGISPPPPSSLPLPTFSLRPKLGCKAAVAAGVDAGATDDLRRLLRLQ